MVKHMIIWKYKDEVADKAAVLSTSRRIPSSSWLLPQALSLIRTHLPQRS